MALIGVVCTSYPRYSGDFSGHFVRREVLDLVAMGHRVRVITPRSEGTNRPRQIDPGVDVIEAPTPRGLFFGDGAPEQLAKMGHAQKIWRAGLGVGALSMTTLRTLRECDAIIGHWLLPSGPICAAVAGRRPFGLRVHSGGAHLALRLPSPLQKTLRQTLKRARFVVSASPALIKPLEGMLGRPVHWVGPRLDTSSLQTLSPPKRGDTLRLGFLGRRVPIKGLDLLLNAFNILKSEGHPVTLDVAGPPKGTRLPSTDGLQDWGLLSSPQALRDFFKEIDVLVIPSRWMPKEKRTEGLPCVLLEAYAAARPVVASSVGGIPELVPAHRRFKQGDAAALEGRLRALLSVRGVLLDEGLKARERSIALEHRWKNALEMQVQHLLRST